MPVAVNLWRIWGSQKSWDSTQLKLMEKHNTHKLKIIIKQHGSPGRLSAPILEPAWESPTGFLRLSMGLFFSSFLFIIIFKLPCPSHSGVLQCSLGITPTSPRMFPESCKVLTCFGGGWVKGLGLLRLRQKKHETDSCHGRATPQLPNILPPDPSSP